MGNFQTSLALHLDKFERVDTDDSYIVETMLRVKFPACVTIPEEWQGMMKRFKLNKNDQQAIQATSDS